MGRAASFKYRISEVKYYSKEKGGDDSKWKGSDLQMKDTIAVKDTQWGW